MSINQDQIDCGADALRRLEQGGKMLRNWNDLPRAVRNKWRAKAVAVLDAVNREANRQAHFSKAED